MLALTAEDVLMWNEKNAAQWLAYFGAHPEALAIAADIYPGATTVAGLLKHIVAAELRYAQRLAGLPVTEYADIPEHSPEAIFEVHDRAFAIYRELAADPAQDWAAEVDFDTRSMGKLISTRKTVFFHGVLHSMRHYAQLATLLRQSGLKTPWPHDYLFADVRRA